MGYVREKVITIIREAGVNLLTPDEVAELAKKDVVTIYNHTRRGLLIGRRVGGSLRYEVGDVLSYLEGQKL